jgi:hypothetical protein
VIILLKIFAAGVLIASASHLAGKNPSLAGFIIALPLTSMIALLFAYLEHRDMAKINEFATAIVVSVPLSLIFFVPFVLNKWIRFSFPIAFLLGIGMLAGAYVLQQFIMARLR